MASEPSGIDLARRHQGEKEEKEQKRHFLPHKGLSWHPDQVESTSLAKIRHGTYSSTLEVSENMLK